MRRGYKKNVYFTVLNDTSPDPKSGLVYSLLEDHNGTTGKMQEVRQDFEISPEHCFGDGFYMRRNSFQCGQSLSIRQKRSSGKAYKNDYGSQKNTPLTGDLSSKPLTLARSESSDGDYLRSENHFGCGIFAKTRKPLIYVPTENGSWKEDWTGKEISHERLKGYLRKYQFI